MYPSVGSSKTQNNKLNTRLSIYDPSLVDLPLTSATTVKVQSYNRAAFPESRLCIAHNTGFFFGQYLFDQYEEFRWSDIFLYSKPNWRWTCHDFALESNRVTMQNGLLVCRGGGIEWLSPGNVAHSDTTNSAPGLKCTDLRNTECSLYTNTYTVLYLMWICKIPTSDKQ